MGSALVVAAVKYGLLALLWLFVVVAFRTVRSDLFGSGAPAHAEQVVADGAEGEDDEQPEQREQAVLHGGDDEGAAHQPSDR